MGRAIKLILYYLAYQLLFIFWQPEPMPPLLLSAEQILQPTSAPGQWQYPSVCYSLH